MTPPNFLPKTAQGWVAFTVSIATLIGIVFYAVSFLLTPSFEIKEQALMNNNRFDRIEQKVNQILELAQDNKDSNEDLSDKLDTHLLLHGNTNVYNHPPNR